MVFFNWATMQMAAKIVYYGPGLCGKTSNLSYIYAKTAPNSRGEMVSLETESDRTLFFDLLPIEVGTIGGFKTRLQLYTVPGQVFYNTTRKLVLKGVDGLVYVADSQRPMREANMESIVSLRENLSELGLDMDDLPLVLQYNKRDLKNVLTVEELNEDLNSNGEFPYYESSAINGDGVFETLKEITKLTLKKLRRRMAAPQPAPQPRPSTTLRTSSTSVDGSRPTSSISAASLARAAEEGVEGEDAAEVMPPPAEEVSVEAAPEADVEAPMEDPAAAETAEAPPEDEPAADEAEAFAEPSSDEPDPLAVTVDILDPSVAPFPMDEESEAEQPEELDEPEELFEVAEPEEDEDEAAAEAVEEPPPSDDSPFDEPEEPIAAEAAEIEPIDALDEPPDAEEVEAEVGVEADTVDDEADDEAEEPPAQAAAEPEPDFERTDVDITPPPVKRVQVSNQMDILAELDDLRKQATMAEVGKKKESAPNLDLDSLLGGDGAPSRQKELHRKIEKALNSDIFKNMQNLQLAVRIQDANGETICTLDPVSVEVDQASKLEKLLLQFTINLENQR